MSNNWFSSPAAAVPTSSSSSSATDVTMSTSNSTSKPAATTVTPTKQASSPTHARTNSNSSTPPKTAAASARSAMSTTASKSSAQRNTIQSSRGETDQQSLNGFEHQTYCRIFDVALSAEEANSVTNTGSSRQGAGRHPTVLKSLAEDSHQITRDVLDPLIVERLSLPLPSAMGSQSPHVSYMLASYRRALDTIDQLAAAASNANTALYPATPDETKQAMESVNIALQRIVSYIGMILTDSGIVDSPQAAISEFYRLLQQNPLVSRSLPAGLLKQLALHEDSKDIFQPIIDVLFQSIVMLTMNTKPEGMLEQCNNILQALSQLARHASIAALIVTQRTWLPPAINGRQLQMQSLTGPLLSQACRNDIPEFQNATTRSMTDVESAMNRQRSDFNGYQQLLVSAFDGLVKADKLSRERVLKLFANIMRLNVHRRKMHYDPNSVSSAPYMYNVCVILLALSMPIADESVFLKKLRDRSAAAVTDARNKQYEKINYMYFLNSQNDRLNYDNVTRIVSAQPEIVTYREGIDESEKNFTFVTECFAMTHEALHLGIFPVLKMYTQYNQDIQQISSQLRHIPESSPQHVMAVNQRNALISNTIALRVHLYDPAFTTPLIKFYNFTASWLRHTVQTSMPLAGIVPEYYVEDINEYFEFVARFQPELMADLLSAGQGDDNPINGVFDMMLILGSGEYALKNPHLRGKFAELLYLMLPRSDLVVSETSHAFLTNPALVKGLVPLLLNLFIEVEFGANAFYTKFNTRYLISEVLKWLYLQTEHKRIVIATMKDLHFAVKFINAACNDCIWLLDESLKGLSTIRTLEEEQSKGEWNAMTPEQKKEKEKALKSAQGSTSSTMRLANSIVHMMYYMTADVVEPFVSETMVERMATIVTYYIDRLIGPSVTELKVKDKAKYSFQPRTLLQEIVGIFLHLSGDQTFLEKIAGDERSYSHEIWSKAARTLRRREIMSNSDSNKFEQLADEVASLADNLLALEDILGDLPDEYSDAVMGTLMTKPVMLPSSKQIVDRATITRHLMNTPSDPFNRAPLTEEELIEQPELQKEIEAWIETRKVAYREEQRAKLQKEHDEANERRQAEENKQKAEADAKQPTSEDPEHLPPSQAAIGDNLITDTSMAVDGTDDDQDIT